VKPPVPVKEAAPTLHEFTVKPGEWKSFLEEFRDSLAQDVHLRDKIDENMAAAGAEIARFKDPTCVLFSYEMKEGDVIVDYAGKVVKGRAQLETLLTTTEIAGVLEIGFMRGSTLHTLRFRCQ